jgi:signal transduction histidine kinase/methyl-accepting chemotaxis protein
MRISIRTRLVTTLIIAVVIPVIISISITYFVGISQREETIGRNFQQSSEKARGDIALRLATSVRAIKNISVLPVTIEFLRSASVISSISPKLIEWQIEDIEGRWSDLKKDDKLLSDILENQLSDTLRAYNSVELGFGEIFATDATGKLVAATNKITDYWQADEEWWQRTYNDGQGQLHLGMVEFDESVGTQTIAICAPVKFSQQGKSQVVGVIKGVLAVSYVFGSVYDIDAGEGVIGALADDDGTVAISNSRYSPLTKIPAGIRPSTSLGSSDWFVATTPEGDDILVGFARVELNQPDFSMSTPWSVIIYQDLHNAFAPVRRMIWYIATAGASLIAVFFFLGFYIVDKDIIAPLNLVNQMVKRVIRGDFKQRVQINQKHEVGELATSLNQMVSDLDKRTSLDAISFNMLSHLELGEVLSTRMKTLRTTFDVAFARIWLVGEGDLCDVCQHAGLCPDKELCLHLKVTVGIYAKDEEYLRVPIGALKVGKIAANRQAFWTNDLSSDMQIHNSDFLLSRLVVSFAGFPMMIGNELLGVMALFSRKTISKEDFAVLRSFANRTAMAIQNARLHTEIMELNLDLERKVEERTEELAQANARLKRADQLKSEFLANMSHELRTPLNAIIGFSEVLLDGLLGNLRDEQMESIVDINESGKHLLHMINDILDLSKIEAGKMDLQPEKFPIAETMNGIYSTVKDMASKKRLTLEFSIPNDIPDVYADHVKLKQIMYNLLSNAIKFTPEDGKINVDVSFCDDEFLISVTDTGIGIDPKYQKTVFEEFRQLDSSRSRQYEGTGLGLALTKRLVELHGGRIWVESEGAGMGSKFSFTLPSEHKVTSIIIHR